MAHPPPQPMPYGYGLPASAPQSLPYGYGLQAPAAQVAPVAAPRPPAAPPPSTAPAYLTAFLFLLCGGISLPIALVSWHGGSEHTVDVLAAVIGLVFSGNVTGNVDFGISITMTVACATLSLAVMALFRIGLVRWLLGAIGGMVTAYYLYAVFFLVTHHDAQVIVLVVVALLLWLAATIVAVLPATGHGMRGYQRKLAQSRVGGGGVAQGPAVASAAGPTVGSAAGPAGGFGPRPASGPPSGPWNQPPPQRR